MPNWCSNHFKISHSDPMMIEKVIQGSISEKLGETFVPIPESVDEYNWCVTNWGTKWDFGCKEISDFRDGFWGGYFDTAWSPPLEWYQAMSKLGFKIEAYWHEGGNCFAGSYIDDVVTEYNDMDCDSVKELPQEFDDLFSVYEYYQPDDSDGFESEDIP